MSPPLPKGFPSHHNVVQIDFTVSAGAYIVRSSALQKLLQTGSLPLGNIADFF